MEEHGHTVAKPMRIFAVCILCDDLVMIAVGDNKQLSSIFKNSPNTFIIQCRECETNHNSDCPVVTTYDISEIKIQHSYHTILQILCAHPTFHNKVGSNVTLTDRHSLMSCFNTNDKFSWVETCIRPGFPYNITGFMIIDFF